MASASQMSVGDTSAPAGSAMDRLIGLLREENTALRDMDFGRAGALLQAKYAAAGALEAACRSGEPDVSGETTDELNTLALENQALLRRAARIQKRVFTLVSRVADRKRPTTPRGMRLQ